MSSSAFVLKQKNRKRASGVAYVAGLVLALSVCSPAAAVAAVAGYPYGCEFRGPFDPVKSGGAASGDICRGWEDNSDWSKAKVSYRADHRQEERACQEIEITDVGTHCVELKLKLPVAVKKGKYYISTVSMRADREMFATICVFKGSPPWTRYLKGAVSIGPDWNEATVFARANTDDPQARLTIQLSKPGKVWIRSFTLIESDTPPKLVPAAPLREGNLIPNGDFALGTYGWTSFGDSERNPERNIRETMMRYSVDPPVIGVEKIDGKPVMKMALTPETFSRLYSKMVRVVPGGPFELKMSVRRVGGSGPVRLGLFGIDWNGAGVVKPVGNEWVTMSVRGTFPLRGILQVRAEIQAAGSGSLEIRPVTLEQKAGKELPGAVKEFGVATGRAVALYPTGTPVTLELRSANADNGKVTWRLVDSMEKEIRSGIWELTSENTAFAFKDLPVGWYQLQWNASWAGENGRGMLNFGVVPDTKRLAGAASPFGIHVEGSLLGVEKMRLLGVHWLRTQNPLFTKWTAVQSQKDHFIYPDEYVNRFIDAGFDILGNLDRTPRWASLNPDNVAEGTDFMDYKADLPNDWEAWRTYVRKMVERYKGKIKYWEVWNEPDITFLRPPPGMTHAEAYAKLLRETAAVARAANPEAVIVGGPAYFFHQRSDYKNCQKDFSERLAESDAFGSLDVFGFHHYIRDRRLLDASRKPAERLAWIRSMIAKHGKRPVVWNTEWGYSDFGNSAAAVMFPSSNLSIDDAAADFVYWSVAQLAMGIEKLFWYDAQDNFYYPHHCTKAFFDYREPRPIAVACAILTKTLDGMVFSREKRLSGGRAIYFSAPGREVVVVWASAGGHVSYPVPNGGSAFDYLGRAPVVEKGMASVGDKPVYIVGSK